MSYDKLAEKLAKTLVNPRHVGLKTSVFLLEGDEYDPDWFIRFKRDQTSSLYRPAVGRESFYSCLSRKGWIAIKDALHARYIEYHSEEDWKKEVRRFEDWLDSFVQDARRTIARYRTKADKMEEILGATFPLAGKDLPELKDIELE